MLTLGVLDKGIQGLHRKFVNISPSQADANVITAEAGFKFRIIAVFAQAGATGTTLIFNSKPAGAGAAISMTFQNAANGGAVLNENYVGWFETNVGEGLTVTTGAGSTTGIQLSYEKVRTNT